MRFCTANEMVELATYFNNVLLKYDDFKNMAMGSSLTAYDLCQKKLIRFSEFKKRYALNCTNYYNDFLDLHSKGKGVRFDRNILEKNSVSNDNRYPVVILCNNTDKNDNVPDMVHFLELEYTLDNFNSDIDIIVIDKMIKPLSKEFTDKVAEYYNISSYDYGLYS